jgi:hypothetical protein
MLFNMYFIPTPYAYIISFYNVEIVFEYTRIIKKKNKLGQSCAKLRSSWG